MDAMLYVLLFLMGVSLLSALALFFMITKSVGFSYLLATFKIKLKIKKGWGRVVIYQKTGHPRSIAMKLSNEMLDPLGKGNGRYIFKSYCVYTDEMGIPCIAYKEDDSNPIDPRHGIQTNTNPMLLENIIAKALKAEQNYSGDFMSFIKNNWLKILLFYLGPMVILGFILLNQQDTIATLASQTGKQVLVNASSFGK